MLMQCLLTSFSAVLAGCGDVVSQLVVQIGKAGKKHYSWRSTAAFATFRQEIFCTFNSAFVSDAELYAHIKFMSAVVPKMLNY